MNDISDKARDLPEDGTLPVADGPVADGTRRRFTRSAVIGSAVLLSLGNRSAWSVQPDGGPCMSVSSLNSFVYNGGKFLSLHPVADNPKADAEKILSANNDFNDKTNACIDGNGNVCYLENAGGVCTQNRSKWMP